ncbi:MAG: B12-binding domain-containing radical SAM protein [Nitrospinaceae bacterium]
MTDVLLINPSYQSSYGGTKASIVNPFFPTLGLATIAAVARQRGHKVHILDLCWRPYDFELIRSKVLQVKPDVVGISATTPLMNQLRDISVLVKDLSKNIMVVGGGPHPTALPRETLRESLLDAVCVGEADYTFAELCDNSILSEIPGIYYRSGDEIINTGPRNPIENLDDLPFPAWDLYNPGDYKKISRLIARRPPVTTAEFSRGCVFLCDFCASKMTMALGYRKKSPKRCSEEIKYMYDAGFREFWLADDIFTSDPKWASAVSEAILKTGIDMAWTCSNGIRVESADKELFKTMKKAGCYRVSFGFESGNDEVLKSFGKGGRATIEQGRTAVKKARVAGIETNAFFMLGLTGDTEETIMDTIEYARTLPVHLAKFGVAIAFPGSSMFNKYVRKGLVKSYDWDQYFVYTDKHLFAHENLSYEMIQRLMKLAYRKAILFNPSFAFRRLIRAFQTGEIFSDIFHSIKFFIMPTVQTKDSSNYYAQERWPIHDFWKNPPTEIPFKVVGKKQEVL